MPNRVPSHRPPRLQAEIDPTEAGRAYERAPLRRRDKDFYKSPAWRELRALKLSLNPTCERCRNERRFVSARTIHHVKERKLHPGLELDLDNLESLCGSCHSRHHTTMKRKRGQST